MSRPITSMTPLLWPRPKRLPEPIQPSLMDLPHVALVSQGRAAIALALEAKGIGTGHSVLMPAFHCPAMTAAVRAVGAEPRFFRIQEDLTIRSADVTAAADSSTRAVLIPHLFVRRQPSALFEDLRQNTSWLLIEDCAHAFFGPLGQRPIGSDGHCAIGSIGKFFPGKWGGILASNSAGFDVDLAPEAAAFQLKLVVNAAEHAAELGHLGVFSPLVMAAAGAITAASARSSKRYVASTGPLKSSADILTNAEPVDEKRRRNTAGRWVSAQLSRRDSFRARADRRGLIHRRLRSGLVNLRHAYDPLAHSEIGFPPYVLPCMLTNPERDAPLLRQRGVPFYRWEYCAKGVCEVTDRFALGLIQLPCHDSMTDQEIDKIIVAASTVLE